MEFSITYILIALNAGVFLFTQSKPWMVERMMFISRRVRDNREFDRLFLSGFAHAGIAHLAFNMLTLYFFGPFVEQAIGPVTGIPAGPTLYLILFLLSIIGGNLYCLFMRREDRNYAALGASGGVMGVIYAAILLQPDIGLSLLFIPIAIPGWLFGILFSIISIWLTQLKRADEARISHEGHLGGALSGALVTVVLLGGELYSKEQVYFLIGGVLPLVLFMGIKWLAPGLIYRHL